MPAPGQRGRGAMGMHSYCRRILRASARQWFVALIGAALLAGPACSREGSEDYLIAAIWPAAMAAANQGDAVGVVSALQPAMQEPTFSHLSKGRQYDVAHLYAQGAQAIGDWSKSHDAYLRATGYAQATR